ncbi:MAG: Transglycosylase-associated protein [Candidatus Magasanikbacteria bacterium GW2011_GWA2_56_11]|uniref:Transglycosylase-associated protein n=1 Tax=Candidatus Magasanikbacteria bacterium GW2011_GWA2_56_11 TaxID=1619044 RepID=A0A0G2ANA3_9BACT|nr:MAG: Transglycosylase-associated protein [Candidatus Magasanikbacteria bacterium GW2011_GWA2_56_11]
MEFLWFILIGLIAGWIAGVIMKGRGFGVLGDIIVGIVGALIGGYIFGLFGFTPDNLLGSLLTAVIGAIILLALVALIRSPGGGGRPYFHPR